MESAIKYFREQIKGAKGEEKKKLISLRNNLLLERKEDRIRRKESAKNLRTLMKIRGFWDKESNKRFEKLFPPDVRIDIKKESILFSEYFFHNTDKKTIPSFLNLVKPFVLKKLKINKKVNYTLKLDFIHHDGSEMTHYFVKPFYPVLSKKDVRESFLSLYDFFNLKLAEFYAKGSGWTLKWINFLGVKQIKYTAMKGGCIDNLPELPDFLKNRNVFPPIKSDDFDCLKRSIHYFLKNSETLNWTGIDFPAEYKDLKIFEKNNPEYRVYCYSYIDKEFGIFYKNPDFETKKVINLLMFENHFFPVMNENYLWQKIFSRKKNLVCKHCLSSFRLQEDLDWHKVYCLKEYEPRAVYPKEGETLKFKKEIVDYNPYSCYIDTEAILEPIKIINGKTEKYQKHKGSYFGLLFVDHLKSESEYSVFDNADDLVKKIYFYYNFLLHYSPLEGEELQKANRALKKATVCESEKCKERDKSKFCRDHDHFTGKFRSILCSSCNLKRRKQFVLPIFGHNLMKYDEKLIIRSLQWRTGIIAKNIENFISFNLLGGKIKFIDTLKFLGSSLDSLVKTLLEKGEENFVYTKNNFRDNYKWCLRKGVMCYDYISEEKVLEETALPPKEKFYSQLGGKHISPEDYAHAKKVWKVFQCKTLKDYLKIYLKADCCLLADVFENFRKEIFKVYGLDASNYITLPSLAQGCALKFTSAELELISNPTIYNFLERGIRGGVSTSIKRFAEANNPYLKNYDSEKETSYLTYFDANNLYGKAMCEKLPYSHFKFLEEEELKIWIEKETWKATDCILDVDISLSPDLFEKFSDFPLFPEHYKGKLCGTFLDKKNYVCHSRYLLDGVERGYTIDKVNRILTFESKAWLKPYIERNNELRTRAVSTFEKNLWKLMNNSLFGKQIENVRKRIELQHATEESIEKIFLKPNFKDVMILENSGENIYLSELAKKVVKLDKPIYGGLAILDLSKLTMNKFLYDYMIPKFGKNHQLVYTDTDSFVSHIFCDDFYKAIIPDINQYFDTSNYPKNFKTLDGTPFPVGRNKKVLGYFKDELGGEPMVRFVGLRSKMYSFETEKDLEIKCKGISKTCLKTITFDNFLDSLFNDTKYFGKMAIIKSHKHCLYTEEVDKKILDRNDEKRKILDDGIHTAPWV